MEVFPDAKFVHIARDPRAIYSSTYRTWQKLADSYGLQNADQMDAWLDESLLQTFEEMYRCYEEDRALIPEGHLVEVTFEELVAEPEDQLKSIYRTLGLGDFEQIKEAFASRLEEARGHSVSTKRTDSSIPVDMIARRWGSYIARFGYEDLFDKTNAPAHSPRDHVHQAP